MERRELGRSNADVFPAGEHLGPGRDGVPGRSYDLRYPRELCAWPRLSALRPYFGGGYTYTKWNEEVKNLLGSFTSEGSGAQVFGGIPLEREAGTLSISLDAFYNLYDTEYKAGDKTWKSEDWSAFGGSLGVVYFFDRLVGKGGFACRMSMAVWLEDERDGRS